MNNLGLTFHHLGLAVRDPDEARSFLAGLGYTFGKVAYDPEQNVNLLMCDHEAMPQVEIISPASGRGPIDKMIAHHANGLVYHVCYVAEDLAATLERAERMGLRMLCVSPVKPAVLFDFARVSFYMVAGIGLIEIIEQPRSI